MKKIFKQESKNYMLYGVVFGLIFPIGATIFQSYRLYGLISFTTALMIQKSVPLLWIIDSAPFWLGIFAMFGGIQLDKVNIYKNSLEKLVKVRTEQLEKELEEHKKLIIERANSDLEAENSRLELNEVLEKYES